MMEERKNLLDKMAREERSKGWKTTAFNKEERARDLDVHINRLKQILYESKHITKSLSKDTKLKQKDANS